MKVERKKNTDFWLAIHLGLHKTGTTFIQNCVFPRFYSTTLIRGWHSHRKFLNTDFSKKIIISDEVISGIPWDGRYLHHFIENINKINKIYNNPRIIFGIRKHNSE